MEPTATAAAPAAASPRAGFKRRADSVASGDRDAHRARVESEPESAWATVPLVALELVFSFALVDLTVKIQPILMQHQRAVLRRVDDAFSLRRWSGVCRGWQEAIEQLIAQFQDGTVSLDFVLKHSDKQKAKLLAKMAQQRSMVMDLRVGIYRHIDQPLNPALPPVDWTSMLSGLTNLQRLDLSGMNCIKRDEMCNVLDASSLCCPKLRALVLPLPHGWTRPACLTYERRISPDLYKPLLTSLAGALERWHQTGGASGSTLEQLVFPCAGDHADEFISLVTKFAPRIQLLDAWKLTYFNDGWDDVRCDEHWHLKQETWAAFCATCVNLQEFNWGLVPFTDTFMSAFSSTRKWQLKELAFNFTKCSSRGFEVVTELQARLRRSLGMVDATPSTVSSLSLCTLVRALPRLEVLRVNLQSEGEKKLDAYDDDFLVALAKSCPNLKRLYIAGGRGYSSSQALDSISDRGLAALGELAKLEEVALRPLSTISENGVTSLLGSIRRGGQFEAKLMLPPRVPLTVFEPMIASVAALVAAGGSTQPFAVQVAVQETKQRPLYNPEQLMNRSQSGPLRQLVESLREMQGGLLNTQSRLRFQAFVDEHTRKLTQINVFTTDWKRRDEIGALFWRNEIVYDDEAKDAFEWIVTN